MYKTKIRSDILIIGPYEQLSRHQMQNIKRYKYVFCVFPLFHRAGVFNSNFLAKEVKIFHKYRCHMSLFDQDNELLCEPIHFKRAINNTNTCIGWHWSSNGIILLYHKVIYGTVSIFTWRSSVRGQGHNPIGLLCLFKTTHDHWQSRLGFNTYCHSRALGNK